MADAEKHLKRFMRLREELDEAAALEREGEIQKRIVLEGETGVQVKVLQGEVLELQKKLGELRHERDLMGWEVV